MHILEIHDEDFPALLEAFQQASLVGRYWREGRVQVVRANSLFMMVGSSENPEKIAIKPSRNMDEAMRLAEALLSKEEQRGNAVERDLS